MDELTTEQRERFIAERVKSILEAHDQFCESLGDMTAAQRDEYVHRRVEQDLATEEAIFQKQSSYVELRRWVWPMILALDVVSLLGLVYIAFRDWRDVGAFAGVACAMLVSRAINRRLEIRAEKIQELLSKHINRTGNTAALDFWVDGVQNNG